MCQNAVAHRMRQNGVFWASHYNNAIFFDQIFLTLWSRQIHLMRWLSGTFDMVYTRHAIKSLITLNNFNRKPTSWDEAWGFQLVIFFFFQHSAHAADRSKTVLFLLRWVCRMNVMGKQDKVWATTPIFLYATSAWLYINRPVLKPTLWRQQRT